MFLIIVLINSFVVIFIAEFLKIEIYIIDFCLSLNIISMYQMRIEKKNKFIHITYTYILSFIIDLFIFYFAKLLNFFMYKIIKGFK